ncbi:MAG: hypothetical protein Rubg2KO_35630 [Rubricoccaceae bacterium]
MLALVRSAVPLSLTSLSMRRFACAALALLAIPAFAQETPRAEDDVEIEFETEDGPFQFYIERDGSNIRFRGPDDERFLNLEVPNGGAKFNLNGFDLDRYFDAQGDFNNRFRFFNDGPGNIFRVLGSGSMSAETRDRMRELQSESRELAMRARTMNGAERQDAERQLDAVLSELFDVRGEARQEEADALRKRARELMDEASEKEEALRDRAARRDALIEARRAELLGTSSSDW